MSDPCSKWAYDHIIKTGYVGERQAKVLEIFTRDPEKDYTGAEIAENFNKDRASETVRNRITELCDMGFLTKYARKACPITGELVNTFKWTGRKIPFKAKEIDCKCPKCNGTGWTKKRVPLEPNDHPELF